MRGWILGLVSVAGLGIAHADEFTPAQRAEIIAIVRQAMKQDPSILRDAVATLQADDDAKTAKANATAITAHRDALLSVPAGAVAGNPRGTVTVVEFYDTRCPYCRKMAPEVAELLKEDPNVRWLYKDFPILGPSSTMEAKALFAADRQGGYARMQALFLKQGGTETEQNIAALADSAGLDGKRLVADMADPKIVAAVNENLSLAAALGVNGTPALVIGNTLVPGAMDLADLKKLVGAPS